MSQAHLSPCPSCARHVRVSESACPHCGVATSEAFRARPAPKTALKRLNRAALYAVGVGTIALATVACNEEDTGDDEGVCGAEECAQPVYGAPVADAGPDGNDDPNVGHDAAYGGPPAADAEADAEPDAFVGLDAAYGGPPPDSSM